MEITGGSCRFGLWFVHVWWADSVVHRIRFAATGTPGPVPSPIRQYCAGFEVDLSGLSSIALEQGGVYERIYREVRKIPYGTTATYGAVAELAGTVPRVVGQAMARNPTPLVIPCHRVVGAKGIGGFSPDIGIKEALLAIEHRTRSANGKRKS